MFKKLSLKEIIFTVMWHLVLCHLKSIYKFRVTKANLAKRVEGGVMAQPGHSMLPAIILLPQSG